MPSNQHNLIVLWTLNRLLQKLLLMFCYMSVTYWIKDTLGDRSNKNEGMEEQKMLFDMFAVTWVRLKKYGLGQFKIFISWTCRSIMWWLRHTLMLNT